MKSVFFVFLKIVLLTCNPYAEENTATFTRVCNVWDNGSALPNGIGEYDFLSSNDMAFPFDYYGDGKEDLCLYRLGSVAIFMVHKNDEKIFLEPTSPNRSESLRVGALQEIIWSSTALDDRIKKGIQEIADQNNLKQQKRIVKKIDIHFELFMTAE